MAKKTKFAEMSPEERKRKRDELLELAINECNAAGRLLSRRAWTHNSFIDFDELVEFVGKGSYARAENMIALMWTNQQKQTEKIRKEVELESRCEQSTDDLQDTEDVDETEEMQVLPEKVKSGQQLDEEERVESEMTQGNQVMISAAPQGVSTTKKTRCRSYTKEELAELLDEIKEYYHLAGLPSQIQINEYAKLFNKPQYPAFVRKLGPKQDWLKVLETLRHADDDVDDPDDPLETDEALSQETEPVVKEDEITDDVDAACESADDSVDETTSGTDAVSLEVVVEDVWLKLNVDGKAMNVHLQFGKE